MSELPFLFANLAAAAILWVNPAPAADKRPLPSGPQSDGAFRKVIGVQITEGI